MAKLRRRPSVGSSRSGRCQMQHEHRSSVEAGKGVALEGSSLTDTLSSKNAPHIAAVHALLHRVLGTDGDVERVHEGVSTFVHHVRYRHDTMYLRIWAFANER